MAEGCDVVELAHELIDRAITLLPVPGAGVVFGEIPDKLHVLAWSSEPARRLETLEVETSSGPCLLACRTGESVLSTISV